MGYQFGEKIVRVMNVCPATTLGQVYKRAGIPLLNKKKANAFAFELDFTIRDDRKETKVDVVYFAPGEHMDMPISLATGMVTEKRHRGLVMVDPDDPFPGIEEGLVEAIKFYRASGEEAAIKVQQKRGDTQEQRKNLTATYAPFDLNIAKTKFLEEALKELEKKAAQSAA